MKYVNYDQNWYDVLRELIETSVDGKFNFKSSVNKENKQYWVEATGTVKELQFEEENVFTPMSEQKTSIKINKLEETNKIIDTIVELEKSGIKVDYTVILADIAKSLAMIADKLCEVIEDGKID